MLSKVGSGKPKYFEEESKYFEEDEARLHIDHEMTEDFAKTFELDLKLPMLQQIFE
jgi:hypothetical protein